MKRRTSTGLASTRRTLLRVWASISGTQAVSNGSDVAITTSVAPTWIGSARRLSASVPLRLAVKTKAERGYELAMGAAPEAEKATQLYLDGGLSCRQAFRAIGQNCLRQIVVNERGMCAGDASSLHQMRIGLRRIRAAIVAFEKVVADSEQERIQRWKSR